MRNFATATVGLMLAAAQTGDAAGYLPTLGPAPLRFQKPAPVASLVLPPLLMHDPVPPAPEPASTNAAPTNAVPPGPPAAVPDPVSAPTNTVGVVLPPPTQQPAPGAPLLITPQMLLPFFNQQTGTNRPTTIVVPVEFTPASPAPLPSSTSTYILTPPPKTP